MGSAQDAKKIDTTNSTIAGGINPHYYVAKFNVVKNNITKLIDRCKTGNEKNSIASEASSIAREALELLKEAAAARMPNQKTYRFPLLTKEEEAFLVGLIAKGGDKDTKTEAYPLVAYQTSRKTLSSGVYTLEAKYYTEVANMDRIKSLSRKTVSEFVNTTQIRLWK